MRREVPNISIPGINGENNAMGLLKGSGSCPRVEGSREGSESGPRVRIQGGGSRRGGPV